MLADRIRTLTVSYGPHASQNAEVHVPRGPGPHPVVALLHGGLWRASQDRASMRPIARHLVRNGFAVLNLEYRRVGEQGAGWPGTFLDAVDGTALAARPLRRGRSSRTADLLDADRVAIVGHCSGGHLALWAAAWLCGLWLGPEWIGPTRGPDGAADDAWNSPEAPGTRPERLGVRAVVALAPVTDLRAAERDGLDLPPELVPPQDPRPAAAALLGGSSLAVAGRYRLRLAAGAAPGRPRGGPAACARGRGRVCAGRALGALRPQRRALRRSGADLPGARNGPLRHARSGPRRVAARLPPPEEAPGRLKPIDSVSSATARSSCLVTGGPGWARDCQSG